MPNQVTSTTESFNCNFVAKIANVLHEATRGVDGNKLFLR